MKQFVALKASAGSGKTFALTVRYISLLLLDAQPKEILTLTFTNKAASEMTSRIYQTLISLGDDKELEKIVCLKNVVIVKKTVGDVPIKQQATGDKAVYFIKKGKIELTEKPKVYQADRVVHGHKITLWTNSERLDIERGDVKEFELPD